MKLRAQESSTDTPTTTRYLFKYSFATENINISEEEMSTLDKTQINIKDDVKIMIEVVDIELDAINNLDEDDFYFYQ